MSLLVIAAFPTVILGNHTLAVGGTSRGVLPTGPYGYPGTSTLPPIQDGVAAFLEETWRLVVSQSFLHGQLPLWNPYVGGGRALAGNYQSDAFFVPEVLFSFLPYVAWDSFNLLRLIFAGVCAYLFLRTLKLSPIGAISGATSFMLSGFFMWNTDGNWANAPMLLPLLLWTLERLATASRWKLRWLIGAALVTWQIILSGFPEIILLVLTLSGSYYLFRVVQLHRRERLPVRSLFPPLARYILASFAGVALSAPLLFMFFEALHEAASGRLAANQASLASPLSDIFRIFFPYFFGPVSAAWHPGIVTDYAGVGAPLVALIAVAAKERKEYFGLAGFFAASLLLSLALTFQTPATFVASRLPVAHVILFSRYAAPVWCFSMAVLVAIGVDSLPWAGKRLKQVIVLLYVALIGMLAAINLPAWATGQEAMDAVQRAQMTAVVDESLKVGVIYLALASLALLVSIRYERAAQCAIVALLSAELLSYVPRELPLRYDAFTPPPYSRFLKSDPQPHRVVALDMIGFASTLAPLRLEDARDFDAFYVQHYSYLIETGFDPLAFYGWAGAFTGADAFRPAGAPTEAQTVEQHRRILDLLNVKYLLTQTTVLGNSTPLESSLDAPRDLYRSPPLGSGTTMGQQIHVSKPRLSGIMLSFSDTGSSATGTVALHVRDSPTSTIDVRTSIVPVSQIRTDGMTRFPFAPLSNSAGKTYYFFMQLNNASPSTNVRLWNVQSTPSHQVGGIFINNTAQPGAIVCAVEYGDPSQQDFRLVYSRDINIYENRHALPRAFVAHQIEVGVSDQQALAELEIPAFAPTRTLLLARAPSTPPTPRSPVADGSMVRVVQSSSNEIMLHANMMHPGYVALQDTYYPGWYAYLDGKEVPIYRSDIMFRAVYVSRGKHELRFVYSPQSFKLGLDVMLLPLLLLCAWALWHGLAKRRDLVDA